MMERDELIAKLEAATEGSAEIDLAVWNFISKDPPWRFHEEWHETITCDRHGIGAVGNPILSLDRFTRDTDAALLVVPKGSVWAVSCSDDHPGFRSTVMPFGGPSQTCFGATPALVLCITALRARAAQNDEVGR